MMLLLLGCVWLFGWAVTVKLERCARGSMTNTNKLPWSRLQLSKRELVLFDIWLLLGWPFFLLGFVVTFLENHRK